jgi:DNA (cytosine-5)-methyltransferase 1
LQREGDDTLIASTVSASAGHHGCSSPRGDGSDNLVAGSLTASYHGQPRGGDGGDNLVAATLTSGGHPGSNARGRRREDDENLVAFTVNSAASCATRDEARETDTARSLDTTGGFASNQGGTLIGTLRAHPRPGSNSAGATVLAFNMAQVTHPENRSRCAPGDPAPAPTLAASGEPAHVAFSVVPEGWQGAHLRASEIDVAPAVVSKSTDRGTRIASVAGVRRLTPRECERLQGLPDDWTLIRWENAFVRFVVGERPVAHQPWASDARRYKAIGNAVAVVVIEWIGDRLARFA